MVATNEKVQFDFNADFGDSNYKSCFARSVVVNSQFQTKSLDVRQLHNVAQDEQQDKRIYPSEEFAISHDLMRLRKDCQGDEMSRRLSCCSNSSGGGSTAGGRTSRRNSDFPVENIALQSQVDKLQWQLKQAEASREMYRAVMQQVVSFLERAHRSLDVLSEKQRVVQRSRSEYHVAQASSSCNSVNETIGEDTLPSGLQEPRASVDGYTAFRDFTWRRAKRQQTGPDEVPPEKLSQEAFRLLRTAQSLISTREPDLGNIWPDLPPKDQDFLSQLAREFPSRPPQRATSFSVNPQLISPSDRDIRIQTAFNRKLSLQRSPDNRRNTIHQTHNLIAEYANTTMAPTDLERTSISPVTRRNSLRHDTYPTSEYANDLDCLQRTPISPVTRRNSLRQEKPNVTLQSMANDDATPFYSVSRRNSLRHEKLNLTADSLRHEKHSDYSSIATNDSESKRSSVTSIPSMKKSEKSFFDGVMCSDKPGSPKTGSVSSAEDESGFSSMNSFQEVGLPLINSTLLDTSDMLFKNGDISVNSSDSNITQISVDAPETKSIDKSKLIWNRSDLGLPITHRRWSSTPVEVAQNDPLKVLWV